MRRWETSWPWRWRVTLCFLAVVALATFAAYKAIEVSNDANTLAEQNRDLLRRQARESRERRDQGCKGDEREHLQHVVDLRNTYRLLSDPVQRAKLDAGLLNLVVTVSLPQLERAARVDQAPAFCDEPGIGLAEPDPVVPKHRDFSFLVSP